MANITKTHAQTKLISHIHFLPKARLSLPVVSNMRWYLCLVILNSEITHKKHKNAKNIAFSRPPKGHCSPVTCCELKQNTASIYSTSAGGSGGPHQGTQIFPSSENCGHVQPKCHRPWGYKSILASRPIHKYEIYK